MPEIKPSTKLKSLAESGSPLCVGTNSLFQPLSRLRGASQNFWDVSSAVVQLVLSWHLFHHFPSTSELFHACDCWAFGHHLSHKRAVFQKGSACGAKETKRTNQGIIGKPGLHIFFPVPEIAVFPCIIIPWKSL